MDTVWNSKSIMKEFAQAALGGENIPHGVSNPVFRKTENGKYNVCAFIYLYQTQELRDRKIRRPLKWMTLDLNSGEITEYDCMEKDFSDMSMDTLCDLNPEDSTIYSPEYQKQTLAVFDLILKKYLLVKRFDKELNDAYMYMMMRTVPIGFKPFYRDLNEV